MMLSGDRLIGAIIIAGAMTCSIIALALRPAPLLPTAGPQWAAIAKAWKNPVAANSYALDSVVISGRARPFGGRAQALRPTDSLDIHGWAFDANLRRTVQRFVYRFDAGDWHDATYHLGRPDVAAAWHLPAVADSGFNVIVPPGTLSPGHHTATFATIDGFSPPVVLPQTVELDVSAK